MAWFHDFNERNKGIKQWGLDWITQQTERKRPSLTNKGLFAVSIFSIFTHSPKQPPHPQLQTPKWKHSYLNYPIRTKEPLYKKGDKRGKKSIPIMLVQALQYQNTACERGTAGRRTKSIAPGLWFCWVSERGWSFLPPTAFWKQDSLTQCNCRPDTSVCPCNIQV